MTQGRDGHEEREAEIARLEALEVELRAEEDSHLTEAAHLGSYGYLEWASAHNLDAAKLARQRRKNYERIQALKAGK